MTDESRLTLLKLDLQMQTSAYDEYLTSLLQASADMLTSMGVRLDGSDRVELLHRMYAAWLYRKRADSKAEMPRMVSYTLHSILIQQKAGAADVTG